MLYQPYENNVKDFFQQGFGTKTSINISKGSEDISYNLNYGNTDEDGYVPGNSIKRNNFGIGGTVTLSNKFKISGSFNFSTG